MPQLWEKHYLTDITGQIGHAGAGDVELLSMCIFLCACTHVFFFSVAPFDVQLFFGWMYMTKNTEKRHVDLHEHTGFH